MDGETLRAVLAGAAFGGFFLGLMATVLGYRWKRNSLSRRPPAFWFSLVMWSLSIAAAAGLLVGKPAGAKMREALPPALTSGMMLALMLSLPVLHRKSGYTPARFRMVLRRLAPWHDEVAAEIRKFLLSQGFEVFDGRRLGCTLLATPRLKNLPGWNPHIGQVRVLVALKESGGDLEVDVTADVKEYVIRMTWEFEMTRLATVRIEHFLRERYGQAVVPESLRRGAEVEAPQ